MENRSRAEALQMPFVASLAARSGDALDYHALAHPSVPNYLGLASGSTWAVTDDSFHELPDTGLGAQLTAAGIPWRAYMYGMAAGGCLSSPPPYDPGHDPFVFLGGVCPPQVVPGEGLAQDLRADPPQFAWIQPDLCQSGHSCAPATADGWLQSTVTEVTSSRAWTDSSHLFVTWDEDDGTAGNNVLTLVLSLDGRHRVSRRPYDHYSLLATLEYLLGVRRLNAALTASPMLDLL